MKIKLIALPLLAFVFNACYQNLDPQNLKQTLYVTHNESTMPVYLFGNSESKKIILVIHGGPGGNGMEYRSGSYTQTLEEKYLMAYWDQRGQGMAQGKQTEEAFTIANLAADLNAVVLTLKKRFGDEYEMILMGHSWGGLLGTAFMVNPEYQKNISGWIEANGAHDLPLLNKTAIEKFRIESKKQIDAGNSVDEWSGISDWAENIDINDISSAESVEINEKAFEVEGYLQNDGFLEFEDPSFRDLKIALFSPENPLTSFLSGNITNVLLDAEIEQSSLTAQLYKINKPCLLIWGKYDFVVPAALGESAINLISSTNKKLVIFEKSGHSTMSNEPEKFSKEVINFIESL